MRFYKNSKDDLHCFQAALRTVLSVYFPKKSFPLKELDRVTGFKKNKTTWDFQGLLWLAKKGFHVIRISDFDYRTFAKKGEEYLKWFWKPDVYEFQRRVSNFKNEQQILQKLLPFMKIFHKKATVIDLEKYFAQGYTLIVSANPLTLDGKKGYLNHSLVIVDVLKHHVVFHDPGLPPEPNRKVTKKRFQKALHEIIALKPL